MKLSERIRKGVFNFDSPLFDSEGKLVLYTNTEGIAKQVEDLEKIIDETHILVYNLQIKDYTKIESCLNRLSPKLLENIIQREHHVNNKQ
jgi:hypothetical protein